MLKIDNQNQPVWHGMTTVVASPDNHGGIPKQPWWHHQATAVASPVTMVASSSNHGGILKQPQWHPQATRTHLNAPEKRSAHCCHRGSSKQETRPKTKTTINLWPGIPQAMQKCLKALEERRGHCASGVADMVSPQQLKGTITHTHKKQPVWDGATTVASPSKVPKCTG